MKNTLWLYKNPYQIEIIDETNLDDNQKALTRYQERQPYGREVGDYLKASSHIHLCMPKEL